MDRLWQLVRSFGGAASTRPGVYKKITSDENELVQLVQQAPETASPHRAARLHDGGDSVQVTVSLRLRSRNVATDELRYAGAGPATP